MPYAIPPNNLIVGSTGHVGHSNDVSDVLTSLVSRELVNVKDPTYGALGDGSTNDVTAINAAFTAAAAAGTAVYFPPGTYMVGSAITVSTSLYGVGAVLKKTAAAAATIATVSAADIVWDGVNTDGNRSAGATGNGIGWTGARGILRNCYLKSHAGAGIYADSATGDVRCYNVRSYDNRGGVNVGDGFFASSSGRMRLYNCWAHDNERAGIFLLNGSADGCEIHDCVSEKNAWGAIIYANNGTISSLTCTQNNLFGLGLGNSSAATTTQGWEIGKIVATDTGKAYTRFDGESITQNAAGTAVQLWGARDNQIGLIVARRHMGYGLAIAHDGTNTSIRNNFGTVVLDQGGAADGDPGIIFAGAENNLIGVACVQAHSVAVSYGETALDSTDNVIGTLLSSRQAFAVVRADKATNNRIDTVIDRDTVLTAPYLALCQFDSADVTNNIIGSFNRYGTGSPTIFLEGTGATGNKIENLIGDTDGSWTLSGVVNFNAAVKVKEGTNCRMGTATLNGTTEVTVTTTAVASTSRIQLTINAPGGTVGSPYVSSRSAGTSFGVKSTAVGDTSTVAWLIVDPA